MVILIFIGFIVMCIAVDLLIVFSKRRKESKASVALSFSKIGFNEATVSVLKGLFYYKTHTWAFMEKNGLLKIGVDDFLMHVTGPLSKLKLKKPGEQIRKGELLVTLIQNGKQLNILSPVSGTIKQQNKILLEDTSVLHSSPLMEGWIYAVEPLNWEKEAMSMILADKYKDWLKTEFTRLKDFLTFNRYTTNSGLIPVMLQDGGELKENLLSDFGPEVWEDFQNKFINTGF